MVNPVLNCKNLACRANRHLKLDCKPDCYACRLPFSEKPLLASTIMAPVDSSEIDKLKKENADLCATVEKQSEEIERLRAGAEPRAVSVKPEPEKRKLGRPRNK